MNILKFCINANLEFDKDRELQVGLLKLKDNIYEVSVANLISGKRTSVLKINDKEEVLSVFSGSIVKFMMPVAWGKVKDWGIDLELSSQERVFYGPNYKDKAAEGVSEEIASIRKDCDAQNSKEVIENIAAIVRKVLS